MRGITTKYLYFVELTIFCQVVKRSKEHVSHNKPAKQFDIIMINLMTWNTAYNVAFEYLPGILLTLNIFLKRSI